MYRKLCSLFSFCVAQSFAPPHCVPCGTGVIPISSTFTKYKFECRSCNGYFFSLRYQCVYIGTEFEFFFHHCTPITSPLLFGSVRGLIRPRLPPCFTASCSRSEIIACDLIALKHRSPGAITSKVIFPWLYSSMFQ